MTQREQQKKKRREEILSAGLNLFVQKGYASTKTSDIARAVNMSDGLLFHYFPSKEQLYQELIHIGLEYSQAWMDNSTEDPLAFFMDVAEQILSMIRKDPQRAKYFILIGQALRGGAASCGGIPEESATLLRAQEERYLKTVERICAGQAGGQIRRGDPDALAITFWCGIQGITEQLALYPQTPLPKAEWLVGILENRPKGAEQRGEY